MMKALNWDGSTLSIIEKAQPQIKENEALLKIVRAGICNTDIEITKGYMQYHGILGHEFVGEVVECKDELWVGKRVVCDINCACQNCAECLRHGSHHCPNRTVLGILNHDGAFAEYLQAPIANLIEVPGSIPLDEAVFVEPLAAALEIQEQVQLNKADKVAVLGDGKLGLLICLSLAANGFEVDLIGRHPERSARLNSDKITFHTSVPDQQYATVVEATGNEQGFQTAVGITKPRGTLVLKSTYSAGFNFNPMMIVINEIHIVGSRCGPFQKALDLLESKKVAPATLIDGRFQLSEGVQAMEAAKAKGTMKILLDFK